jgi:hypothetical protein
MFDPARRVRSLLVPPKAPPDTPEHGFLLVTAAAWCFWFRGFVNRISLGILPVEQNALAIFGIHKFDTNQFAGISAVDGLSAELWDVELRDAGGFVELELLADMVREYVNFRFNQLDAALVSGHHLFLLVLDLAVLLDLLREQIALIAELVLAEVAGKLSFYFFRVHGCLLD